MDGKIGVESVHGEGTSFWIELPLAPATAAGTERALEEKVRTAVEAPRATAPRTLLYIEDNLSNLGWSNASWRAVRK